MILTVHLKAKGTLLCIAYCCLVNEICIEEQLRKIKFVRVSTLMQKSQSA